MDDFDRQLADIDTDLIEAQVLAGKDAQVRAAHDICYYRLLRHCGLGRLPALLLTMVRAATD